MSICDWGYASGELVDPPLHRVTLDLLKRETPLPIANLTCTILDIWCSDNCRDAWAVKQNRRFLEIGFSSDLDMVMFKLSCEWDAIQSLDR